MFQDEGASTLRIGMELGVVDRAWIMEGKGSRRGPENENPGEGGVLVWVGKGERGVTEDCIDNGIGLFEGGVEVVDEWDGEVFELGC